MKLLSQPLKLAILCLLSVSIIAGCSQGRIAETNHAGHQTLSKQRGLASYYADKYQYRATASGELFDQSAMTAAHRSLPFGTRVKVINIKNGKYAIVRINDRGPFVQGRIIDLSKSAFASIANIRSGVIPVIIEIMR